MNKLIFLFCFLLSGWLFAQSDGNKPNILLITVDDMNWNSVGAFGNEIKDITPNIDRLASQGVMFNRAYVTAANCSPSRVSIQTGLYPQQTGAIGFFYIDDSNIPTISTELKKKGYFTGIVNKTSDTNPSPSEVKYWDVTTGFSDAKKYDPKAYKEKTDGLLKGLKKNQPFYFVVNISDPHKPNYNDPEASKSGADEYSPSRIISENEITIPGFLPDIPEVRKDVRNYYNSVKRADDCVGEILTSLQKSGRYENTLIIFLSDHGMPFPFAKSSVYDNGLRTPLIMAWPNQLKAGDKVEEIVSAVDLFPTVMDVTGGEMPKNIPYQGSSIIPILNENGSISRYAFGSFDENANGHLRPLRGLISAEWNYTFNPWSDGETLMKSATMYHLSYKAMNKSSKNDSSIARRMDHYNYREVEELYNLKEDPNCLNNLIGDPEYLEMLTKMRAVLRQQMVDSNDYLLDAFDVKNDPNKLKVIMNELYLEAETRAKNLDWKRPTNLAGSTKSNKLLFKPKL